MEKYSLRLLIGDLWNYLHCHKRCFLLAIFFRVTSDLIWLLPAWVLGKIVTFFTTYTLGASLKTFWVYLGLIFASGVYHFIGKEIARLKGNILAEQVVCDVTTRSIKHILNLDVDWHEKENIGNKMKRIDKGAKGFQDIIELILDKFIKIGVKVFGIIILITVIDFKISIFLGSFVMIFFIMHFYTEKSIIKLTRNIDKQEEIVVGVNYEAMNSYRTIKSLDLSAAVLFRIGEGFKEVLGYIRQYHNKIGFKWAFLHNFANLYRFALLAFIGYGISKGIYEVGYFVMFYKYFDDLWESVDEFSNVTQKFLKAKVRIQRLSDTLREYSKIDTKMANRTIPDDWEEIVFDNVNFSYKGKEVFKNFNLTIKRGERIGIVGESGSGKSTIFKLLLKLYLLNNGQIRFDNCPIDKIKRDSLIKQIAVVSQETELFNMSIKDNITITSNSKNHKEKTFKEALRMAYLDDFVEALEQKEDTIIGEKGVRLSGGERQRIGIARTIYRNPNILLLDEATSQLDQKAEEKIQNALHEVFKNVTAIVIAHRLSTLRDMDRILIIEKGRIVEEGDFDHLIQRKGVFYNFWYKQTCQERKKKMEVEDIAKTANVNNIATI